MPNATVVQDLVRLDLNTLPGGYVVLKALSYGEVLERRDKATRMVMEQQRGGRRRAADPTEVQRITIDVIQSWTRWYEFSKMIVEHNLEDAGGKPLNFDNQMTMAVLSPKVGQEIEKKIDELIGEEDDEAELEAFTQSALNSSKTEGKENPNV